jgi:hypothetical protein
MSTLTTPRNGSAMVESLPAGSPLGGSLATQTIPVLTRRG